MILIIAEKPSVGRAISPVVGAGKTNKGYIEGGGYIVTWCVGHLVGLKFPNDYGNGWDQKWSFSQLPMIPEAWQFKVTESTKEQFGIIKALMARDDVSEIICATDADREGECIFRYVYNMARCRKPVKRLWVSSLEESAIRSALSSMKPMSAYDDLFYAGFSRAKADWLIGMNGSRLFSCRYGGKLNIGRVQTPTLEKYNAPDTSVVDKYKLQAKIDDVTSRIQAVDKRIDKVWEHDEFYMMQSDDTLDAQMKLTSDKLADMAESDTVTVPELAESTLFSALETEELDRSQVAELADRFNAQPMAKVEEQLEDDYNMIDGIINNGSRKELEQAKEELIQSIAAM